MALIPYRANLSSAVFPMCLSKAGRTVIAPGIDQNYDRRVDPTGEQKDAGIPQAIYMENVLPTPNGYQSIGFKPISGREGFTIPSGAVVRAVIRLITSGGPRLLVFFSNNTVKVNSVSSGIWDDVTVPGGFVSPGSASVVSTATVKGTAYIFYKVAGVGYLFGYNVSGLQLLDVSASVLGLTISNMSGICGSYNYLLFYDSTVLYWSSTTSVFDFVPSLVSGAGSETPNNLTKINFVYPHPTGVLIYSNENVVAGKYTGNRAYPWKFREVSNSSAFLTYLDVTRSSTNAPYHVGISSGGQLQLISEETAEGILPELVDYLERNIVYDSFNYGTNVISQTKDTQLLPNSMLGRMNRTINYLLDRYLILSYKDVHTTGNEPEFQYAFVYDFLLKRYGRINFKHGYVFEAEFGGSLIFIDGDSGKVRQLYFDIYDYDVTNVTPALRYELQGVLILGKFQLKRNEFITLEQIEIESSQATTLLTATADKRLDVFVLPSIKGKEFDPPVSPSINSENSGINLDVYNCHVTARNLSIGIKGAFDINTLQLEVDSGGD